MIRSLLRPLAAFALAAATMAAAPIVHAQSEGGAPLRWVVPYAAGGGSDVTARAVAAGMRGPLGQQIVIENRPGAGTIIGTQAVASAKPDGTMVGTADSGTLAFNPSLYEKLPYDPARDLSYVGGIGRMPLVLVAHPSLPVSSVKDFIAYAQANPGKILYASAGQGSPHHVAMEMLAQQLKLQLTHVPYKGAAPAVQDLLGGQVGAMLLDLPGGLAHMRAGKLKLLAVAMPKRVATLPDVPTMAEAGVPNFVAFAWQGMVAPAGTPKPVIDRLSQALTRALADPEVNKRLLDMGVEPMPMRPEEFQDYARTEAARWAPVIRSAGIKLE